RRVAQQLDASGAVDQVEEDELPHLAPPEDAPGGTHDVLRLCPPLHTLRPPPLPPARVARPPRESSRAAWCRGIASASRVEPKQCSERSVPAIEVEAVERERIIAVRVEAVS